jgi:hypothetical protein
VKGPLLLKGLLMIVKRKVCKLCEKEVTVGNLCSYECPNDGDYRTNKNAVIRVYDVVETLLREEELK